MILATECNCPQWCGDINCEGLGVPAFLRVSVEDRAAAWANMPPPPPPIVFEVAPTEDPSTIALRLELEGAKRIKTGRRIERMLAPKVAGVASATDHSQDRWDSRRNCWVPMVPLGKPTHHEAPQELGKPIKTKTVRAKPKGRKGQ